MVWLHRGDELVDRHHEMCFDMLGELSEQLIDDERWRLIDMSVTDSKVTRRPPQPP